MSIKIHFLCLFIIFLQKKNNIAKALKMLNMAVGRVSYRTTRYTTREDVDAPKMSKQLENLQRSVTKKHAHVYR